MMRMRIGAVACVLAFGGVSNADEVKATFVKVDADKKVIVVKVKDKEHEYELDDEPEFNNKKMKLVALLKALKKFENRQLVLDVDNKKVTKIRIVKVDKD